MKQVALFLASLLVSVAVSAQVMPTFWWQCNHGNTTFNHHSAVQLGEQQSLVFDSIQYSESHTIITVYHSLDQSAENNVWQLHQGKRALQGLTTQNISMGKSLVKYADNNHGGPIIHTVAQTIRKDNTQNNVCSLSLGSVDEMQGNMKVAEILFFDRKLGNMAMSRVHSYLAIKYGITLGPVNYVDGKGNVLWDYYQNKLFHHRIFGLGKDDTYGLDQTISNSECDGSLINIRTNNMEEYDFCLLGDNDAPLTFHQNDLSGVEVLDRQWMVSVANPSGVSRTYSLAIATNQFSGSCNGLTLVAGGKSYSLDSLIDGEAYYSNVTFPEGNSILYFTRGIVLDNPDYGESMLQSSAFTAQLYPNPTTGHFRLVVDGASCVNVVVYNVLGKLMTTFEGRDASSYSFEGNLPSGNIYYVTINTEEGSMTQKLIVK